jgi:hypothetical protein
MVDPTDVREALKLIEAAGEKLDKAHKHRELGEVEAIELERLACGLIRVARGMLTEALAEK